MAGRGGMLMCARRFHSKLLIATFLAKRNNRKSLLMPARRRAEIANHSLVLFTKSSLITLNKFRAFWMFCAKSRKINEYFMKHHWVMLAWDSASRHLKGEKVFSSPPPRLVLGTFLWRYFDITSLPGGRLVKSLNDMSAHQSHAWFSPRRCSHYNFDDEAKQAKNCWRNSWTCPAVTAINFTSCFVALNTSEAMRCWICNRNERNAKLFSHFIITKTSPSVLEGILAHIELKASKFMFGGEERCSMLPSKYWFE